MLAIALPALALAAAGPTVLITGATGRTGLLLYHRLRADPRFGEVRALVRNVTKARSLLNCSSCGPDEGIYVGDVTKPGTLAAPMAGGIDVLAIAVGVFGGPGQSSAEAKAIEFVGVENQVAALAASNRSARVVLCSSMGTTDPKSSVDGGDILFWKLNAEAFLGASGLGATIVKPCGLLNTPGGRHALAVAHDDELPSSDFTVSRADVAALMVEAVAEPQSAGLRFLLCNGKPGPPTTDFAALLRHARWPWQRVGEQGS